MFAGGLGRLRTDGDASVGARTLFQHGSCAKALTALAAVRAASEGAMDLDAPVRRYVPELELPDPVVAERATTRDLLAHRSGLARHDLSWILDPPRSDSDLLRRLARLPLRCDLRYQMEYSNFGYALAGVAIERAKRTTWADHVNRSVLEPARMSRTLLGEAAFGAEGDADAAGPHLLVERRAVPTGLRDLGVVAPAGALATCADDSARWLLLQTSGGGDVGETHRLHIPMDPAASPFAELALHGYGLGWLVGALRGRSLVWHAGGVDGFLTQVMVLPEEKIGVAVSANVHMSSLPLAAALSVVDGLLGETAEPSWYDRLRDTGDAGGSDEEPQPSSPTEAPAPAGPPSHPLEDFAGTYDNTGYWRLDVSVGERGDELRFRVGDVELEGRHRHFDTWDLLYAPLSHDVTATFCAGPGGDVSEAVLPLDPGVAPIRFRRVPVETQC